MQDKVYIHYGHDNFDKSIFEPIQNMDPPWVKPKGGLWASPIDAEFGWKDWCEAERFRECLVSCRFRFTLPDANVLYISSAKDLLSLPIANMHFDTVFLDFEELVALGYDAIELNLSTDRELYWKLYGWDCDNILVMNPDKVRTITRVTATDGILI